MSREVVHIPARRDRPADSSSPRKKKRLAAYCRVSTAEEDQLLSFENQKRYFEDYTTRHPEYTLVNIYPDEAISGTNTRRREAFNRMIADCEAGKIDVIITKSISRFARNTADCLKYTRRLKELGVAVIFEKEGINTLDGSGELLFTILSSLAQEESRSISDNCTWGIRYLFTQGVLHLNAKRFLGYDKDKDGKLVINPEQAGIVRRIYDEFLSGHAPGAIAGRLRDSGVPCCMGDTNWCASTIKSILRNEKYNGDALLQKTYTPDYLSHKSVKNNGEVAQVMIKDDHEAIIDRELWDIAQLELARQQTFRKEHSLRSTGRYTNGNPFSNKVFCTMCGSVYWRRTLAMLSGKKVFWECKSSSQGKIVKHCGNRRLTEKVLHSAFVGAWNWLVEHRADYAAGWHSQCEEKEHNPLKAFYAARLLAMTEGGLLMEELDRDVVRAVLERVEVSKDGLTFFLLDGTEISVSTDDAA